MIVDVDTNRARKIADDPGDTDGYEMCQMITALADEVDRLREAFAAREKGDSTR